MPRINRAVQRESDVRLEINAYWTLENGLQHTTKGPYRELYH